MPVQSGKMRLSRQKWSNRKEINFLVSTMSDKYAIAVRAVEAIKKKESPEVEKGLSRLLEVVDRLDGEMIRALRMKHFVNRFKEHFHYGYTARRILAKITSILDVEAGKKPEKTSLRLREPTINTETKSPPIRKKSKSVCKSSNSNFRIPKKPIEEKPIFLSPIPMKGILKKVSKYEGEMLPQFPSIVNSTSSLEISPNKKKVPSNHSSQSTPESDLSTPKSSVTKSNLPRTSRSNLFFPKSSTKIPKLFNICEQFILGEAGAHVPFLLLRPILESYSNEALFQVEVTMPWLEAGIESIWRKRLAAGFPGARLHPLEGYGEAFRRCLVEHEDL